MAKKIAIIGSGISGLSAAYFLKDNHDITLFEKNERLGGHSRTISISKNNQTIEVDTGFIVLNDRTYPNLMKLFADLDIDLVATEMSFAISANKGMLEWSGTSIDSLFAQRKNLFNVAMLKGVWDIIKFNKNSLKVIKQFPGLSLQELISKMNLGSWFKQYYLLPMGGAIWSCSYAKMLDFPASTFVNFFNNHGLLSVSNRPQWYSLKNKSIAYVSSLEKLIKNKAKVILNSRIDSVIRNEKGVEIQTASGIDHFDEIIFACNPTEILKLLKDPSSDEKNILEKFTCQKNIAITHGDIKQMPKLKKCWSSWNYLYDQNLKSDRVSVTYWMNKLQHINQDFPLFVTLNPIEKIEDEFIYDIHEFYHPVFDQKAINAQKEISDIQGLNKTWYCGAYLRYGFHEDGISSSINILDKINK